MTKQGTDASFKAGTVALTINDSLNDRPTSIDKADGTGTHIKNDAIFINKDANGNIILNQGEEITADQIQSWKDENGKTRHYVVIGQDLDGNDIRSEVTYTGGTAGSSTAVTVDTAEIKKTSKDFQEKVDHNAATVYDLNAKQSSETATTSKDGKTVYESNKDSKTETVKLYATGKNALARETTQSESNEKVETHFDRDEEGNLLVDANGKAVVVGISTESSSANAALQQYQAGQEKVWSTTSNTTENNQFTDAKGNVVAYDKSDNSLAATQYAEGKNDLDRTIVTPHVSVCGTRWLALRSARKRATLISSPPSPTRPRIA